MTLLAWLILAPLAGGLAAWYSERFAGDWPRQVALTATSLSLLLALILAASTPDETGWLADLYLPWIPRFGIGFHLAADPLSALLVLLTALLGVMAVAASWRSVVERSGFFYFNLLWTIAGITGVFLAFDLFLFFVFWEVMLVPMYLLIALWGHERRNYAAFKFFLFTQGSGLLMLASIVALAIANEAATGSFTFDYFQLLGVVLPPAVEWWIMFGFFIAFIVKLPAVPLHTWLPDAHTEAPTGGSVLLAGVMLKGGAYGLLRFVLPLFPDASATIAPFAMALGALGILYGALLAVAQSDLKRLVACSSVSHMGFVLLGAFALDAVAMKGVAVQMVAHGLATGALFMVVGAIQERLHTREMGEMGGMAGVAPRLAGLGLLFAIAALGLPGLGNFIGEFLILLGAWPVAPLATGFAALGLVLAAVYALLLVQRTFHGPPHSRVEGMRELGRRETWSLGLLALLLVWLGLDPQGAMDSAKVAINLALGAVE